MMHRRNIARKLCSIAPLFLVLKDELRVLIDSEGKFDIIKKEAKRK